LLAALTWAPATALLYVVAWSAGLPWAEATLPPWSPAATGIYLGGLVLLCGARQWWMEREPFPGAPGRRPPTADPAPDLFTLPALVASALLALAAVGGAMVWRGGSPAGTLAGPPTLRLSLPAVAAGTMVAATAPDGAKVLLDGGPGTGGAATLLGEVLRPWDRTVDAVVITDPGEHYVLGLPRVLQRYRIGILLDATSDDDSPGYRMAQEVAHRRGVPRRRAEPGSAYVVGSTTQLDVLSTAATPPDLPAWRLRWGSFSLLLPGEDTGGRWAAMAANAPPVRCTVLLLTERDARRSTVATLVQTVAPALVVVQGQTRQGALPARASSDAVLTGGLTGVAGGASDGAPLWHYTARDGPLRLEVSATAFRLNQGRWRQLPPAP
jgi:competence protein ComEC